jgi:hypothetical protein
MERGVIERFEGDIAVIEIDGITRDFPKESLPSDMKVGDAIIIENGEIRPDSSETVKRKKEIKHLMNEIFE